GMLIYDIDGQDTHSGGSGCGCSAAVTASLFYNKLKNGTAKDILLVGTGALLSQMTALQGQSIPAIAHLVRIGK
ncbi:MAG: stage V sporulation protein AD, partial [Clostridia bacterium]|nr:stage V sporulation protein AD [Clostridia bacterium]